MPDPEFLRLLLGRIATEIAVVADTVGSIQVGAAGPSREGSRLTDADLVDLQKLDGAEQTLRSLAALLGEVAGAESGGADLRAAIDRLPLAALAGRLGGVPQVEPSAGLVELF